MSTYSLPQMSMSNEFNDLAFLGRLVDDLLKTGIPEYAFAYEWKCGPNLEVPPVAVLYRKNGTWTRQATPRVRWVRDEEHGFIYDPRR